MITRLRIRDLRVIEHIDIDPGPGINVILGGNGAGKTSVLEGIYLASRGKTFRHHRAGPMIRRGGDAVVVNIEFNDSRLGATRHLGVQRTSAALTGRLDGQSVRKRSGLSKALPVQWISSQPQLLLEQGPEVRRRFLDMGLFHVEPGYLESFSEFSRILKQRNAALRLGNRREAIAWNRGFLETAAILHERRERFAAGLMCGATQQLDHWGFSHPIVHRYRPGWRQGHELKDLLEERLDQDLALGYTGVGPQRCDLDLSSDGQGVDKVLSRGQQKLLVLAINLALNDLVLANQGSRPLWMIDDLPAEFDDDNQTRVIEGVRARGVQAFVSCIGATNWFNPDSDRLFHVEHGALAPNTVTRQS